MEEGTKWWLLTLSYVETIVAILTIIAFRLIVNMDITALLLTAISAMFISFERYFEQRSLRYNKVALQQL